MQNPNDTPMDRLRKISWLQWGLICIFGGLMAGAIGSMQGPPKNSAEAAGRAAAVGLFIVIGVVLIIVHFLRPKKKIGTKATDECGALEFPTPSFQRSRRCGSTATKDRDKALSPENRCGHAFARGRSRSVYAPVSTLASNRRQDVHSLLHFIRSRR